MSTQPKKAKAVFDLAVEAASADERAALLDRACAGDPDLRGRVEGLLRAYADAGSFLERPAAGPAETAGFVTAAAPAGLAPGTVVAGRYKVLEPIGEGGFGVVFVAEQSHPVRRKVALKVIKAGMDSAQVVARFEVERQALALMDHPNIAKVHDAGTTDQGRPFFAMELVKGVPITEYCDKNRLNPRQRLELFIPVCQAVQHAHAKGVIHRDLKPTNVLVALHDDKPVPKVIDFGVAKATGEPLTERTLHTGFGAVVGTVEYMSPEQATFNQLDVDTRSDVYSLGVLLYELLAGSPPFARQDLERAGLLEMLRVIREQEPARPSARLSTGLPALAANRGTEPAKLTRLVRGELDWIVMKALEKDRSRRYQTANGLATDVQRYLADEPVQACPPSAAYRFRKLARRYRVALTTAALVGVALVAGTAVSAWQAVRATRAEATATDEATQAAAERDRAVGQQQRAEGAERAATDRLWRAKVAEAAALRGSGQPGRRLTGLNRLDEALGLVRELGIEAEHRLDLRNEVIASLALPDLRIAQQWEVGPGKPIPVVAFDAALERFARADADGTVRVRRIADDRETHRLAGPGGPADLLRFSPDGRFLAALYPAGGVGHRARVFDLDRAPAALQLPFAVPNAAVEFSPDARRVAVGAGDGSIHLYALPGGAEPKRLVEGVVPYHLAFHPDGTRLAVSGDRTGVVQVRDVGTGDVVHTLRQAGRALGVAWRGDGKLLAVAAGLRIAVWDPAAGRLVAQWEGHESVVTGLAFSHRGDRLVSTSWEPFVRLWDVGTGRQLASSPGSNGAAHGLRFSPDDRRLAYAVNSPRVGLWEVAPGYECRILAGRMGLGNHSWSGDFSPDGRLLAVAGRDAVHLWDLAGGGEVAALPGQCYDVLFAPDGKALLTTDAGGLHSWPIQVESGGDANRPPARRVGPATTLTKGVSLLRASLSPDGQVLVAGVYAPRKSAVVVPLSDPDGGVTLSKADQDFTFVALSPDKRWAAAGAFNGSGVQVWDAETGTLVHELPELPAATVAFGGADGRTLATCTADAYVLWDVPTWRRRHTISREEAGGVPGALAFSPDGRVLAVAHGPSLVQLRDVVAGGQLATLRGPSRHEVHWLRFSRDGALLAIGCANDQVQLWDLRLVRDQLAARGVDWDHPALAAPPGEDRRPLSVEVVTAPPADGKDAPADKK